ncbi:MAG TPA: YbhN family protein [Longimicrobium sp.]|nr:YbhN family protein [Longimicrobium sp.]
MPQPAIRQPEPVDPATEDAATHLRLVESELEATGELPPDNELAHEAEEFADVAERPRRFAWGRWLLMAAFVALAVRLVVPQLGPLEDSVSTLRNMVLPIVFAAALAQVARYRFGGLMLREIVKLTDDRISAGRGMAIWTAAGSVGLVAGGPLGMAGSTFKWMRDAKVSPEGALLASWLPTVLNVAVMVALGVVGAIEYILAKGFTASVTAVGVALAVIGAGGAFLWWAAGHPAPAERLALAAERKWARMRKRPSHEREVRERVEATYEALALLKKKGWMRPTLCALVMALLDALTLWLVFVSMMHVVGPHVFFAGYAIPMMISKVGVVPGGVGLVEGMMVGVFVAVGEPAAVVALAVVGYRLLAFWLPNLLGFAVLPFLQATPRKAAAAAAVEGVTAVPPR